MTRLAQWLRNAYEGHDHDSFERALVAVQELEAVAARLHNDATQHDELTADLSRGASVLTPYRAREGE